MEKLLRKVDVPEGHSGKWSVKRFTVDEAGAKRHNMQCAFHAGQGHRTIKPGTYTKLDREGKWGPVMSDTSAEINDHYEPVEEAKGKCLINGLGLGVVLQAVAEKPGVEHVTVIEKSADVIRLVADHYRKRYGDKITIIHDDALTWKPPKGIRYRMVWHDIWDDVCADNLDEMKELHRKYGRRCDWQGSWCRYLCEWQNRRG